MARITKVYYAEEGQIKQQSASQEVLIQLLKTEKYFASIKELKETSLYRMQQITYEIMIKNNNIKDTPCDIYVEKKEGADKEFLFTITRCENFHDILVQIKNGLKHKYYVKFNSKFIAIDSNGTLENYPRGLFDKTTEALMQLI